MSFQIPARPAQRPVAGPVSPGVIALLGVGVLVFGFGGGVVQSAEGPALSDLVGSSSRSTRPLSQLLGSRESIALEGSQSQLQIEVPVNRRLSVEGGEVLVHFTPPPGADRSRSRVRVLWDGESIGEQVLDGDRGAGHFRCSLPSLEGNVDCFELTIEVEQRIAPRAGAQEVGSPGELRTVIDPARSRLALEYRFKSIVPTLDELRGLVDATHWDDYKMGIVTAPIYAIEDQHLDWGNRVAQRAALWLENRPLQVRHADRLSELHDEVAIGTRDELIGILPQGICDQITSSFVGVYPHPENDRHFLLVLSGAESEGVARAVRAFAYYPTRLPPMTRIDVTRWQLSEADPMPQGRDFDRRLAMPDLDYWRRTGFPGATGMKGEAGFDLWVAHRDSEAMAGAWMLSGRMTQVVGDMLTSVEVGWERPADHRHWMALGARRDLPPEVLMASSFAYAFQEGELLGRRGMLMQFESPYREGRMAGFVTADDRVLLGERIVELIRPEIWDRLHGDTVTWQGDEESARFRRLSPRFEIGEAGWFLASWRWLAGLPWLSLFFGTAGAALITWLLLRPVYQLGPMRLEPMPEGELASVSRFNRWWGNLKHRVRWGRSPLQLADDSVAAGRPSRSRPDE